MSLGEEIEVEIEKGKRLFIKLLKISEPRNDGSRVLYFELNGQSREIIIKDKNIESLIKELPKADPTNEKEIGATMPGTVVKVLCEEGETVEKGDYLVINEAMKMETTIQAKFNTQIIQVSYKDGYALAINYLLIQLE